jgi:hypothetical protein
MKTFIPIFCASAVALCGLTACNNGPAKAGAAPQGQANAAAATTQAAMQASFKAPPLPDSNRTDPIALAMRQRYVDWKVAQVKAAGDAAQKQLEQFYGPAPKGNYGRMAEGLPPAKAG